MFYWDQPFLVGLFSWVFSWSIGIKPFSVCLVDHLFQPAQTSVETVENDRWYSTDVLASISFHAFGHVMMRKLLKCGCRHVEIVMMHAQSDQNIQWKRVVKYSNSSTDSQCGRTNSSNSSWKTTEATSWPFAIFPTLAEVWKWLCPVTTARQPLNCFNQIRFWLNRLILIERNQIQQDSLKHSPNWSLEFSAMPRRRCLKQ